MLEMRKRLADGTEVISTICDQCHATCGALAYVRGNRVIQVEGDPDSPDSEPSRWDLLTSARGFKRGSCRQGRLYFPPEVRTSGSVPRFLSSQTKDFAVALYILRCFHSILTGEPYPVKANWALNDLLLCLERAEETLEALKKIEFLVGSDFFMTPTLEMCDIVMPPRFYLEKEGIEDMMYQDVVAATERVIPSFCDE
jgi:anaerobic selenocysteine-containing dehydrogenase